MEREGAVEEREGRERVCSSLQEEQLGSKVTLDH